MSSLREITRSVGLRLARSLSESVPSVLIDTSMGCTGGFDVLPTCGSSTCPGFMSGAVTMKITSSTSITLMYGTRLISFMSRLRTRVSIAIATPRFLHLPSHALASRSMHLALEDVRKLLHERIETHGEAVHFAREAVVRDDSRNGCEKTHCRRDERFGDTGRYVTERRLRD